MIEMFLYSFFITIIFLVMFIPRLRIIKCEQYIRLEGPKEHFKKQGTPTMGGAIIILSFVFIFSIISFKKNFDLSLVITILFPLISYGLIGFIDDFMVIKKKNNKGLKPKTKLLLEVIMALFFCILLYNQKISTEIRIFKYQFDLKYFYYLLVIFIIVASSNAVNLTDGLDGLASGLLLFNLFAIYIFTETKNVTINSYSIILFACILAFMCFNFHPAKIFMGDTGSLALGASIASIFIILKLEFLVLVFMFMFIIETISVIIQVIYYKNTKGKRLFLMTPLHHHYELKGFSELGVDLIFWFGGVVVTLLGIFLTFKFY